MKSKSFSRSCSELSLSLALVIPLQIEENKEKYKIGTIDWKPGKYGQLSDQEKGKWRPPRKVKTLKKKTLACKNRLGSVVCENPWENPFKWNPADIGLRQLCPTVVSTKVGTFGWFKTPPPFCHPRHHLIRKATIMQLIMGLLPMINCSDELWTSIWWFWTKGAREGYVWHHETKLLSLRQLELELETVA